MSEVEETDKASDRKHWNGSAEMCCLLGAWDRVNLRDHIEPLDGRVIAAAAELGLDPHALQDDVEDRGWETHDDGWAEALHDAIERGVGRC